jgi:hypothetical protein
MRRIAFLALAGLALAAAPLAAQGPGAPMGAPGDGPMMGGPPPGPPMGPPPAADFLLGHTGELKLTDQQVVRLAAIARRAADRRQAARPPAPGAQRPSDAEMARMRQQHEQMREQDRTDLRDALAVLTADQQARAWEMMADHRGPGGGGPGRMRGPGGPGGPGGPPNDGRGGPGQPRPQG